MDQALWALARGTGITALVFLTVSVTLGIATRSGRPVATLPRFGVAAIHQSAGMIGTLLIAIHVTTLLADPYAQLRLIDYIVPFVGNYRPFWLGLGTLAFDLLLAIMATSLLRHRIGQRRFRAVHWAAYGMWPLALTHALGNGTDAGHIWFLGVAGCCIATVTAAVVWRLSHDFTETHKVRNSSYQRGQVLTR